MDFVQCDIQNLQLRGNSLLRLYNSLLTAFFLFPSGAVILAWFFS